MSGAIPCAAISSAVRAAVALSAWRRDAARRSRPSACAARPPRLKRIMSAARCEVGCHETSTVGSRGALSRAGVGSTRDRAPKHASGSPRIRAEVDHDSAPAHTSASVSGAADRPRPTTACPRRPQRRRTRLGPCVPAAPATATRIITALGRHPRVALAVSLPAARALSVVDRGQEVTSSGPTPATTGWPSYSSAASSSGRHLQPSSIARSARLAMDREPVQRDAPRGHARGGRLQSTAPPAP